MRTAAAYFEKKKTRSVSLRNPCHRGGVTLHTLCYVQRSVDMDSCYMKSLLLFSYDAFYTHVENQTGTSD